mgnify:CR=1 FL=1
MISTLPSGTLTFTPGQTTARITVAVAGDRIAEADEGFTVSLTGATGGQILSGSAIATIVNDDGARNIANIQANGVPGVFSVTNNLRVER